MLSFAVLSSRGFISVVPLRIPAHGPVSRCLFGTEAPVLSKQAIEIQQNKQNQRALFVRHERLEERVFQKNRPPQSYWPTLACKTKKDDASSEGYGVVGHLKHLQCSSLYTSTNAPQYPKWRKSRLKKKLLLATDFCTYLFQESAVVPHRYSFCIFPRCLRLLSQKMIWSKRRLREVIEYKSQFTLN